MFGKFFFVILLFIIGFFLFDYYVLECEKINVVLVQKFVEVYVLVLEFDCVLCGLLCLVGFGIESGVGIVVEVYSGKFYEEYVEEKYGEIEGLFKGFE